MKSDYFIVLELVIPFLGIILGAALLHRIIKSVKTGAIEWYYGEQFRISKSEAPIAFWIMIIMYLTISAILIFGSIRWIM